MQKGLRLSDAQLADLSSSARVENVICGSLYRRNLDSAKWQLRWFALQHNLLYSFENETSQKACGVLLLEGCYAEQILLAPVKGIKQYGFALYLSKDHSKVLELQTSSEGELHSWLECLRYARYSTIVEEKEQLVQKHMHVLQVLESETQAKWHNIQQIEELTEEVRKLKAELREYKAEKNITQMESESDYVKKIKKVQSFFRGWLCRRRWKQIVDLYIKSPHAENMRTRNSVVFGMVEDEEDYVRNLSALVSCFLRPLRMAASSKKPQITHDDVNSIFLNSETVLFLHQIFLKGLSARMDNWPTLVIGDLFDMLLPMLGIYQEYVRNHHYSLQVLAEYKQRPEFNALLKRFEEKPSCEGRVLETFLTYPMHQIPKYILALHHLLAHTPYDHVERKKLEFAKEKLEELSKIMHDEVSETENIRKNLSIERMIMEGCDILLDTSQIFVRQGTLLQVTAEKMKTLRGRFGTLGSSFKEKEVNRKVFLFTQHLLITNRASNGRLHLAKSYGKIPLDQCILIEEEPCDSASIDTEGSADVKSQSSFGGNWNNQTDFRIIFQPKDSTPLSITFVTSSQQEKSSWCSDINQCIENLHYSTMVSCSTTSTSTLSLPQTARVDPKLFKDDRDVKYCRALNSCKIPQIRHASVEKLLERLTDLRFLSVDFLNTFLLTFKVFTTGDTIIDALRKIIYQVFESYSSNSNEELRYSFLSQQDENGGSTEITDSSHVYNSLSSIANVSPSDSQHQSTLPLKGHLIEPDSNWNNLLSLEDAAHTIVSAPQPKSNVGVPLWSLHSSTSPSDPIAELIENSSVLPAAFSQTDAANPPSDKVAVEMCTETTSVHSNQSSASTASASGSATPAEEPSQSTLADDVSSFNSSTFLDSPEVFHNHVFFDRSNSIGNDRDKPVLVGKKTSRPTSSPPSIVVQMEPKACVITSSRPSRRRCSSSAATTAFAVATAGASTVGIYNRVNGPSNNSPECKPKPNLKSTAIVRALNVLKHWVSKYPRDFRQDEKLSKSVRDLLEEIVLSSQLVKAEQKLASGILKALNKELDERPVVRDLTGLLEASPPEGYTLEEFDAIPAIDIAEQLAYLDHQIFTSISSEELLGQSWMKSSKLVKAPHVIQASQRFNEVSRLVVSEIILRPCIQDRVTCIEKWTAIADICACMHNYNGVLQICAAFVNSSIYRLNKTWEKLSKHTKQTIAKLQNLVSSESRFKNMRDALHRCDTACIPYLGMYLSDLSFIEEGSSDFTEEGMVNFSKMRMISHVIREIQQYQQQRYKIEHSERVCFYLLSRARMLTDEQAYAHSLEIEPRVTKSIVQSN